MAGAPTCRPCPCPPCPSVAGAPACPPAGGETVAGAFWLRPLRGALLGSALRQRGPRRVRWRYVPGGDVKPGPPRLVRRRTGPARGRREAGWCKMPPGGALQDAVPRRSHLGTAEKRSRVSNGRDSPTAVVQRARPSPHADGALEHGVKREVPNGAAQRPGRCAPCREITCCTPEQDSRSLWLCSDTCWSGSSLSAQDRCQAGAA